MPEIRDIFKVTRYQLNTAKGSVLSFTAGMLVLYGFLFYTSYNFQINTNAGSTQVNGIDSFGFLWILVLALNSFGNSFRYLQSNGVSRKRFFIASIPLFLALAVYGTVFTQLLTYILQLVVQTTFIAKGLYYNAGYISMVLWTFMNYFAIASAAWLYIIFLYRAGSRYRTILILAPFLLPIIGNAVDQYYTGGFMVDSIRRSVSAAMGLSAGSNPNIYMGIISLILFSVACYFVAFGLIRRLELDR